jgi:hypothetical protein
MEKQSKLTVYSSLVNRVKENFVGNSKTWKDQVFRKGTKIQSVTHEENKNTLILGNFCYYSFQKRFMPVVCYGYETRFLLFT